MEMITREDTQTSALLLRIESSRGYETFGSADRRTITMNGGLLTATRGLGGDLMSTDLSQVGPLIKSRRAGQGTRTIYVLDGEDRTLAIPLACSVSPGGTVPVKAGALNTTARQVTETCTGDALKVTNIYLIDGKGRAVSSKQWAGPYIGYVLMQTLRQ